MPRTRTLLALVIIPLLVFLVACGGDDDGDSGSNGGDQPAAGASDSGGNGGGDASDDSSDGESAGDDANGDADAAQVLANCPELVDMFGAFSTGAFANPGADVEADLETVAQVFQNAADNAPSEIQADMQVIATAFTDFYAAIEEIGVDFSDPSTFATLNASQQAQLQAVLESFDSAEVQQASDNLNTWFTENCE